MHEHHFDRLSVAYAGDEIVPCYWCCRPCFPESSSFFWLVSVIYNPWIFTWKTPMSHQGAWQRRANIKARSILRNKMWKCRKQPTSFSEFVSPCDSVVYGWGIASLFGVLMNGFAGKTPVNLFFQGRLEGQRGWFADVQVSGSWMHRKLTGS